MSVSPDEASVVCRSRTDGDYAVKIYLDAWDDEPVMKDRDGRPDFVILANPTTPGEKIRFLTEMYAIKRPS